MIEVVDHFSASQRSSVLELLHEGLALPQACGEHDPAWLNVLRDGLGHQTRGLIARQDNQVTGYLPLSLLRSPLFGRHLVSLPYVNRAGVVAIDTETADRLITKASTIADAHNVRYMELRHHAGAVIHDKLNHQRDQKVRMVRSLPADLDALWDSYKPKVRNLIRKADRHDLSIAWGGAELVRAFYSVFAVTMRDLGTPVFPAKLFLSMLHHLGERGEVAVVSSDGVVVAGAILIHDHIGKDGPISQVPSASCLRQFNDTSANMWMYHKLLQRAISRGSKQFDFGRSSVDSGTYRFKKQWGALPIVTPWQVYLRQGELNAARPDHPKQRRRIEAWKRLPVWTTKLVGPAIVRGIP